MKIAYLSNYAEISGYSFAARGYINALKTTDNEIAVRNISLINNNTAELFEEEKNDLKNVDVTIINTLPCYFKRVKNCQTVGLFCWETTKMPELWVETINKETDAIIVFNDIEKYVCEKNNVNVPVFVVNPAFEIENKEIKRGAINSEITDENTYVFYNISDFNARKNLEDLLYSYFAEFRSSDNCILFLHVACNSKEKRDRLCSMIEQIKASLKINDYSKVFLNHSFISDEEINNINCSGDTFVSLSKGESWNIPLFTAYTVGNRVITTECAGPSCYLPDNSMFVDGSLEPVSNMFEYNDDTYNGLGMWIRPNIFSTMKKMRNDYSLGRIDKKIYNVDFANKYNYDNIGKIFNKTLLEIVS